MRLNLPVFIATLAVVGCATSPRAVPRRVPPSPSVQSDTAAADTTDTSAAASRAAALAPGAAATAERWLPGAAQPHHPGGR